MNEYYLLEQEYDVVYDYNPNIKGEFVDIIHNDSENNVIPTGDTLSSMRNLLQYPIVSSSYTPALRGIGFTKRDATNAITTASNNKKFDCPLELVKSALSRTSV